MPWGLLARLASMLVIARLASSRRRQTAAARAGGRVYASSPAVRRTVRNARETAGLLWRLVVALVFGIATSLCIAAGTSSAVLSPKWLGAVLLAVGVVFAVLTIREALTARTLVTQRRLRRRDARVRGDY